jgi:hypothetical protein
MSDTSKTKTRMNAYCIGLMHDNVSMTTLQGMSPILNSEFILTPGGAADIMTSDGIKA